MPNRRIFLAAFFWPAILLVTTLPYKLDLTRAGLSMTETVALAKNGNSGGGNGGGNSGGNGGGNGNGGGGNNGNGGGNGNGNGNSNETRSGGNSKASRANEDATDDGETGIRHKGGITEQVRKGRYIMKDARGRTIINRRATSADKQRMETLAH